MRPSSVAGIAGQLVGLAWPIVISRSTQVVIGVSDVLLVGHLGQEALAATTGGALIAFTLLVLPLGVVSIVSAFTSQLTGAGDPAAARRFVFYGLSWRSGPDRGVRGEPRDPLGALASSTMLPSSPR